MFKRGKSAILKNSASLAALSLAISTAALAGTLPGQGHFSQGRGTISRNGPGRMTVDQSSQTGIIDWRSFSIGRRDGVSFDNGKGATLNIVAGGDVSRIAGNLHATGSVYLINRAGVMVTGTGRIVTQGSFVASGNDSGSLDGKRLHLSGRSSGNVIDDGHIRAGGAVGLHGTNVVLGGTADGRRIDAIAARRMQISGHMSALKPNGDGGVIVATGRYVDVTHGALVSASGRTGGVVLIGGDEHGGTIRADNLISKHVRNARTTYVQKGALITANGTGGAGGHVVVWSQRGTAFNGAIAARGHGKGNGGAAEVSSHYWLGFQGRTDLTSAHGAEGELLLDPSNVTIQKSGASQHIALHNGTFTPSGANSVLKVADLLNALNSGDVTVSTGKSGTQAGNIVIAASFQDGSDNTLTLSAANNIVFAKGKILTAATSFEQTLNFRADSDSNGSGTIVFGSGSQLKLETVGGGAETIVKFFYDPTDYKHPTDFSSDVTMLGGGSEFTPYMLVNSATQLQHINQNLAGYYALGRNIDASATAQWNGGAGFRPLGTFTGLLDGNGFTVSNLSINDSTDQLVGLVQTNNGRIDDFNLTHSTIRSSRANGEPAVGAIAAINNYVISQISLNDVTVTANGSGQSLSDVGGVVGLDANPGVIEYGTVKNVKVSAVGQGDAIGGVVGDSDWYTVAIDVNGTVSGSGSQDYIGGVVGIASATTAYSAYDTFSGSVTGGAANESVGGIVGSNAGEADYDTNSGKVSGKGHSGVGGIVGANIFSGSILSGSSFGSISGGTLSNVGGIAGTNTGTLDSSSATGTVTAKSTGVNAGGVVGWNENGGMVSRSYGIGMTTSAEQGSNLGGLAGRNDGQIETSYAGGPVHGTGKSDNLGGFVGYNAGSIDQAYSFGWVMGHNGSAQSRGGFEGFDSSGTITNSYWNTATSGISNTTKGVGNVVSAGGLTGKTTSNLQNVALAGFDTTIWGTSSATYPWLKAFGQPDAANGTINSPDLQRISVLIDGSVKRTVWSGSNGAFYATFPAGTLSDGNKHDAFVYTATGSYMGGTLWLGLQSSFAGIYIQAHSTEIPFTDATGLGTLLTDLSKDTKGAPSSRLLFTIGSAGQYVGSPNTEFEIGTANANFTVNREVDLPDNGNFVLYGNGSTAFTQTRRINSADLSLEGGAFTLDLANIVGVISAGNGTVSVDFRDTTDLVVGATGWSVGITADNGPVFITTTGDLTLYDPISAAWNGSDIVLATEGNFFNKISSGPILDPGMGRFLLFINKPKGNKYNGLSAPKLTGPQYAFDFTHRTYANPMHGGDLILFP